MQNNGYEQYNEGYDNGYESGYMAAMQMQQRMAETGKQSKVPIVIKSIIIHLIANFAVMYAIFLVVYTIDNLGDNTAYVLEYCEKYYIDMDYDALETELSLYATYDEKYQKYWEFIDGYELYVECQQWVECEKSGMNGASDKLTARLSELEGMANETAYSSNKTMFEDFILEINSLR